MLKALNIIDTAIRSGRFQTFTRLLEGSALERELRTEGSYTLFAPMDIAFADLPAKTLSQLLRAENQGVLGNVLRCHAVPGKILAHELRDLARVKTAYGSELIISNADELRVGDARLLHIDILARNGVIHGIDRLLLPTKSAASANA